MAEIKEESGVFGGVSFENNTNGNIEENTQNINLGQVQENAGSINAGTIRNESLPVKQGLWQRFKAYWLQDIDWNSEIKVELTPAQQGFEDKLNNVLGQEVTFKSFKDFLFQEIKF